VMITVASAFHIKDKLKESTNPRFWWSGKFWVSVVKTKKVYEQAFTYIVQAARAVNLSIDDERGIWIETTCFVNVDVFEDEDGQYARVGGDSFSFRDTIKELDGRFCPTTKDWEIPCTRLGALMGKILDEGVPVYGTFNHDGSYNDTLSRMQYKKVMNPQYVELEEDAEYWAFD
jgi:hypothetical protein